MRNGGAVARRRPRRRYVAVQHNEADQVLVLRAVPAGGDNDREILGRHDIRRLTAQTNARGPVDLTALDQ
jgi:hypothetical protein